MPPVSSTAVTEHGPPVWEIGAWCSAWGGPRSVAASQEKFPERVAKCSYGPFLLPGGASPPGKPFPPHPGGSPGTARRTTGADGGREA